MRDKIRSAYQNACSSYDDLLTTVVAIEEELLHISAPSRLDYFKSGCQFDKRVHEKRKQFFNATNSRNGTVSNSLKSAMPLEKASNNVTTGLVNAANAPCAVSGNESISQGSPPPTKKFKMQQEG